MTMTVHPIRAVLLTATSTGAAWWTAAPRHNLAAAIAPDWGSPACFAPLAASMAASCRIVSREPPTAIFGDHAKTSSNAWSPRRPVIRIRRSATVQTTVPRIWGWPAKLP